MWNDLLKPVATPALVAVIVSVWLGNRSEAKRARRDFRTKRYEDARADVAKAAEAGIAYFSTVSSQERTPLLEALVLIGEREIRASVTKLGDAQTGSKSPEMGPLKAALISLLADLTGGSYQQPYNASQIQDAEQIRRIASSAATLRQAIADLRNGELERAMTSGFWAALKDWAWG